MKKLFAVSDIHSFYNELIEALEEAGFDKNNPDHILITCGDMFDRGPDSNKCLNFLLSLNRDRLHCVYGNHEQLLEEVIRKGYFDSHDIHNGTQKTIYQLSGISPAEDSDNYIDINRCAIEDVKHNDKLKEYLSLCNDYYEIGDYIFVHGWVPITYPDEEIEKYGAFCPSITSPIYDKQWRTSYSWYEARWLNGMQMWKIGIKEPGKTVVCGHWHAAWGNANIHGDDVKIDEYNKSYVDKDYIKTHSYIFKDEGIIALDACTVATNKVNCIALEVTDEEYNEFRNRS